VRTHHFFDAVVVHGGMYIRRSRVVMTSIVGRKLLKSEVIHLKNGNVNDDRPSNLILTNASDHNKHHKVGTTQSKETKAKISRSLKVTYRNKTHNKKRDTK
jgi:hypothetical protein